MIITFSSHMALRNHPLLIANLNLYLLSIYDLICAQTEIPIYKPSRSETNQLN